MNLNINKVKIIVTVPKDYTEKVRNVICNEGAGIIGNYSDCSMVTKCVGTFKPNDDASPYIGKKNKLEIIEEDKLEVVCSIKKVKTVITKLKEFHPYEEPAIDIIPLLDENNFK